MIRWTRRRKIDLIQEIDEHPDRLPALMAEHELSAEELCQWRLDLQTTGDLRVTRIQRPGRTRLRMGA